MRSEIKYGSVALIAGTVLAFSCRLIMQQGQDLSDSTFFKLIQHAAILLEIPGGLVALLVSGGRFHDINFTLVDVATAVIYSIVAYFCIFFMKNWRTKAD